MTAKRIVVIILGFAVGAALTLGVMIGVFLLVVDHVVFWPDVNRYSGWIAAHEYAQAIEQLLCVSSGAVRASV